MPGLGTAYIEVKPDLANFQRETTAGMKRVGLGMTKTLTPIMAGVALAWGKAFKEVDLGLDSIRSGTGATTASFVSSSTSR